MSLGVRTGVGDGSRALGAVFVALTAFAPIANGCSGSDGLGPGGRGPVDLGLQGPVEAVALGNAHTCALLQDGTVRCWGSHGFGQIGDGSERTIDPVLQATEVVMLDQVVAIDANSKTTCAVRSDGSVYCWGIDDWGQLGEAFASGGGSSTTPVLIEGLTDAVEVAVGKRHVCARILDGRVRCWTTNDSAGVQADGSVSGSRIPSYVQLVDSATQIIAGYDFSCALNADGTVYCWGDSTYVGSIVGYYAVDPPLLVPDLTNVVAIAGKSTHACAVLGDGTMYCWGDNGEGQLGAETAGSPWRPPVQVVGVNSAVDVAAAGSSTCAILEDGTARCWGDNRHGELGDGTVETRTTPTPVSAPTDLVALDMGGLHTCGLETDGALWCWGWNTAGQVGTGTTSDAPVVTPYPLQN